MDKRGNMLQLDGERFLPWMEDPFINYEHLHRYRFAKEFVNGKAVLDLACGEGYGSAMLAEDAAQVVSIDINEATIKHASTKYVRSNLKFITGSMINVPIEETELFDVIVCFEALEHIEQQDKLLAEVKRLLKNDGLFIVSTPNKYLYSDLPNYRNPWHKKEFYLDEFKDLLKKTFNNVLLYGQKVFQTSNIFPIFEMTKNIQEFAMEKTGEEFSFVSLDRKKAQYFVAISSNRQVINMAGGSYLTDISEISFRQKTDQIAQLKQELSEIKNSVGYNLLLKYRRFREKLLPLGSWRCTFYERCLQHVKK